MTTAAAMGEHPTDLRRIPPRASLRYTQRWSKKRLDQLRLVGDDLGDRVAAELHSKHGGLTKIHDLLTTVRAKAAVEAGDCSSIFRCFLEGAAVIPAWANREMVERGQRVHAVHLPFMGLSLFSGSLVGGAQFVTAATVTALAGNITTDPLRRINETGLLLAALAFPGSLMDAGSEAHDSLTRVRLLHSALRHWLPRSGRLASHRERVPEQVYVEGEVPINQQDLAITLGVFCYINLRSLRRMGILLSAWDIQCYVHMWRYAGHVLGILDELLPTTLEEQEEFMLCSMLHQGAPEAINGPKTKEFIAAFAKDACRQTRGALPAKAVQTFLNQMTRYLNGSDYVTGMEIEDLGDWHWSVQLIYLLGFVFGTAVPRIPLGEEALFRLHTRNLRRQLRLRGTPTGHGAGSGAGAGYVYVLTLRCLRPGHGDIVGAAQSTGYVRSYLSMNTKREQAILQMLKASSGCSVSELCQMLYDDLSTAALAEGLVEQHLEDLESKDMVHSSSSSFFGTTWALAESPH